ncbi:MAG: hypothetical protein KKD28_03085 [Chloroflexi bacterium]|nr:hypothetical protein [Chloroflexota bacterium]
MKHKTWIFLILALSLSLALAACGSAPASTGSPALPAAPAAAAVAEGGGGGGGEGGGGESGGGAEGPGGPTLTNPGGLPAAPETNNNSQSQMGEERMIKVIDSAGKFSILFVDTWQQETVTSSGALRSVLDDWSAEVELIPSQGQTPLQSAQGVDSSQANGVQGYEKLAIQEGDVHGLPAASVIYIYEAGTNPVTGKPLRFAACQVFVGGGPSDQLGHLTFSAPHTFYGEVSEIFDKIAAGFNWQ